MTSKKTHSTGIQQLTETQKTILSKLVYNSSEDTNSKVYNLANDSFQDVSSNIGDSIEKNKKILSMFPEVSLSLDILTSFIISPKDLKEVNMLVSIDNEYGEYSTYKGVTDIILRYLKKHHDHDNQITRIIKDTLGVYGAYIQLVLPENMVDSVIDDIGNESISTNVDGIHNPYIINDENLNVSLYMNEKALLTFKKKERMAYVTEGTIKSEQNYYKLNTESTEKPDIPTLELKNSDIKKILYRDLSNSSSGVVVDDGVLDLGASESKVKRQSIGKPLVLKPPVSSGIPIHSPYDPSSHLGYLFMIDDNGNFLDLEHLDDEEKNIYNYNNINFDINATGTKEDSNKALNSMLGIGAESVDTISAAHNVIKQKKKIPVLKNLNEIYKKNIENKIVKEVSKFYYDGADLKMDNNTEIYKIMFSRALLSRKTNLVFVPAKYVVYNCIAYMKNGTGESLLTKHVEVFERRAAVEALIVKHTADALNPSNKLSIGIDPKDKDPGKTIKNSISSVSNQLVGTDYSRYLDNDSITTLGRSSGLITSVESNGNDRVHKTTIDVEKIPVDKVENIDEVVNDLRNKSVQVMGLTPGMVNIHDAELAVSVLYNNEMLVKRVMDHQVLFNKGFTKFARCLLEYDMDLKKEIMSNITMNFIDSLILAEHNKDKKKDEGKNENNDDSNTQDKETQDPNAFDFRLLKTPFDKVPEEQKVKYVKFMDTIKEQCSMFYKELIHNVSISLPKPISESSTVTLGIISDSLKPAREILEELVPDTTNQKDEIVSILFSNLIEKELKKTGHYEMVMDGLNAVISAGKDDSKTGSQLLDTIRAANDIIENNNSEN